MRKTPEEIMKEVKSIVRGAEDFDKGLFKDMDNLEKISFITYQIYSKGYDEGLEQGLEIGIIEEMKRGIIQRVTK